MQGTVQRALQPVTGATRSASCSSPLPDRVDRHRCSGAIPSPSRSPFPGSAGSEPPAPDGCVMMVTRARFLIIFTPGRARAQFAPPISRSCWPYLLGLGAAGPGGFSRFGGRVIVRSSAAHSAKSHQRGYRYSRRVPTLERGRGRGATRSTWGHAIRGCRRSAGSRFLFFFDPQESCSACQSSPSGYVRSRFNIRAGSCDPSESLGAGWLSARCSPRSSKRWLIGAHGHHPWPVIDRRHGHLVRMQISAPPCAPVIFGGFSVPPCAQPCSDVRPARIVGSLPGIASVL